MDFTTSLDFKIPARPAVLQNDTTELLNEIVRSVYSFFVFYFAVFELHQVVHHCVIDLLPCDVSHFSFVLDLLILHHTVLGVARRLEVTHCCALDISIYRIQFLFLFLC